MIYAGLKQSCGSQCLLLFLIGALAIFSSRFGPGQIQLPVLQTHQVRAIPQPFPNKVSSVVGPGWSHGLYCPAGLCTLVYLLSGLTPFLPSQPRCYLPATVTWRGQDRDNVLSSFVQVQATCRSEEEKAWTSPPRSHNTFLSPSPPIYFHPFFPPFFHPHFFPLFPPFFPFSFSLSSCWPLLCSLLCQ